jgi:hypothetical protein
MQSRTLRVASTFVSALCAALCTMPNGLGIDASAQAMPASSSRTSRAPAAGIIVYGQAPLASGELLPSAWLAPSGSEADEYAWDSFTLPSNHAITEMRWRGGYAPAKFGSGGAVTYFSVTLYASTSDETWPDVSAPLARFSTGGDAGQTPAGTFGGVALYDYAFALPAPFTATAQVKYWVQIEAAQQGISPDWGLATGAGDGSSFHRYTLIGEDTYQFQPGDAAFAVLAPWPDAYKIYHPATLK